MDAPMTGPAITDEELLAFLDEMLSVERAVEVEAALRGSSELAHRAALLRRLHDDSLHSVGEIWRRRQLSCPARAELGNYLLGVLDTAEADYVEFHLHQVGCRTCNANCDDLRSATLDAAGAQSRRERYFESSAGGLRRSGN
ncbi:MAG: hypothetical protein R3B90_07575 [Planctomycetaceae bacterium]